MVEKNDDAVYVGLPEPRVRSEAAGLISEAFDDIYFNKTDGLAETKYVFLDGTDLAAKLRDATHVTIAETGFGTGLNFLAACALRDEVNPDCQIDFISFESCPLTAHILAQAHQPYTLLAKLSASLCAALPPRWPGYHKVILDEGRTHLHLYYGDAFSQISLCDFAADIWFLDGFNPAKNPDLWQDNLFAHIYRCSAPEANLATFTAASFVQKGLAKAGFVVSKRKGFGKKREMITCYKTAHTTPTARPKIAETALIIGGGIAGASLAYALDKRGISATILEKGTALASGASGNGAAMQSARLRVHNDEASRLSVACLSYASRLAQQAGVVAHQGAITLNNRDKDQKRLEKLTRAGWPADLFQAFDKQTASELIGLPTDRAGEYQPASAIIKPALFTAYLAQSASIRTKTKVISVTSHQTHYEVVLADQTRLEADMVFIANGADIPALMLASDLPELPFQISAGQVSHWQHDDTAAFADVPLGVNFGGYMTPVVDGLQYFGASFNRDGQSEVTHQGHQHNIALLPDEWQAFAPDIAKAKGRLSYRLSTKDRMPICMMMQSQEHAKPIAIMGALGARGMTNAPLLADMLVASASGLPTGLDRQIIASLNQLNS